MIKYKRKLDMVPGGVHTVTSVSQYDTDVQLEFELFASEGDWTVESGTTVAIRGTKPDGNAISKEGTLRSVTDPEAETTTWYADIEVDQQMSAVAGRSMYELTLYKDGKELNTANFILSVERAALDKDTVISGSEVRELVEIMDKSAEIIAAAHEAADAQAAIEAIGAQVSADAQAASNAAASAAEDAQEAISASLDAAQTAAANAADSATAAADSAATAQNKLDLINGVVEEATYQINTKAEQVARITTSAEATAMQALDKATDAENEVAEFINSQQSVRNRLALMELQMDTKIDGAFDENGYLYLTVGDEITVGPLGPFAGGGGGGGGGSDGNNAVISVQNASGWSSKTVASGEECTASITWSSTEDGMSTGNGTATVQINGTNATIMDIQQGTISINLQPYLITGSNVVSIRIEDIYGNRRTVKLNVTVVEISLTSSFDATTPFTGPISFPYTPTGAVQKNMHFILDGVQIGTTTTSVSGRQQSYTIQQQTHGAHTLEAYFDCVINGQAAESNHLYYEIICLEPLNDDPVIVSSYRGGAVKQYTTLQIPFTVYSPAGLTSSVTLEVDGTVVSTQIVDRSEQTWSYRADTVGQQSLVIRSGSVTKPITIIVSETDIDIEAETDSLMLHLTSYGRSNNEEHPEVWISDIDGTDVSATLTDFNFTSDGWQLDTQGTTVLRVQGDGRVTVPYMPFQTDARSTGKTIELEFATHNVMNYDAQIISCMNDGRGFYVTPQKAVLKSEQSEISMQFKEDEHVRIAFVVEKRSENRLIYCYVNGIISGAIIYPDDDDFSQATPVGISIGSSSAAVDIYCMRFYDNDLTRYQVLTNWIADTQDIDDMLDRYTRNNVYDEYGSVVISKLPKDLPYMVLNAAELPQYKGDKKTVSGSYTNPALPSTSYTFAGAQFDVQGTSSQYYAVKNFKAKFKNGFDMEGGTHVKKYALRTDAIPESTFCFKADVASSEGANNVELVRLYNDTCPYKTPAQEEDERVRQGIDGFPMVIFWNDGSNTSFVG